MEHSVLPSLVKGFLLDLDGTLVDTRQLHLDSSNQVLKKYGYQLESEEFNSFIGWTENRFWNELVERYEIPEDVDLLIEQRTNEFLCLVQNSSIEPLPGVRELLERLRQLNIPCAIASNSPRDQIACIVKSSGLCDRISVWLSGLDDVKRGKPAPDVYVAAARALKLQPQQCVAIEDSFSGVVAARTAEAFVIAVPHPNHPDPNLNAAHLKLTSISEVIPIILESI